MNVVINLLRALALAGLAVCLAAAPSIDISTGSPASPVRLSLAVESRLAERTPRAPDLATAYWVVTPLPITVPPRFGYYGAVRNINAVGDALGSDQTLTKHVAANGTVSELGLYRFHFNAGRQLDNAGRVAVNAVVGNAGYLLTLRDGAPPLSRRYEDIWLTSVDNADGLLGVTLNLSRPTDRDYWGWSFVERGSFRQVLEKPADSNFGADYVALNERNEVVGSALHIPTNWWRGLYLKAGRAPRWLPGFGNYEEVYNLNVHGQLVGSTAVPSGYGYAPGMYPALWDSGGVGRVKVLDTDRSQFGGEYGWAWAANRWGQIVGRTRSGGALWLDGKPHSLAGRIINPDNIRLDYFADINDKGEIVGAEYGVSTTPGSRAFIMRPVWISLGVDLNRDGKIALPFDGDRTDVTSPEMPFRFWINDDDDEGDEVKQTLLGGNSDEPGRLSGWFELDGREPDHDSAGVDGRCDLSDFAAISLNIGQLVAILPPNDSIQYKLKQADSALSFIYTDLESTEARNYLYFSSERADYDLAADQMPHTSETYKIEAEGTTLKAEYLERVKGAPGKGVILIEGRNATNKPLHFVLEKNGTEVARLTIHISISEVEKMYRWINLRAVAGQVETRPTSIVEPENLPDSDIGSRMFVFVHGYNVNERQSRAWNAEMFKRLYQSGSRAMFTAVSWHGDYSQIIDTVSPDYWDNITHAFITSKALAPLVNSLPGVAKVVAAHSMGNVVASSAISDHGMDVANFFMLNAAVAVEAYDSTALSVSGMLPNRWSNIDRRLWSTDWHRLFHEDDGRRALTWLQRFGDIAQATNYYSTGEQTLNNNPNPGEMPPLGEEYAWVSQEMAKGTRALPALVTFDIQGGWGIDRRWHRLEYDPVSDQTRVVEPTVDQCNEFTNDEAMVSPLFTRFRNRLLEDSETGSQVARDYLVRADALGTAIPALSFPAGRNPVPVFGPTRNLDMSSLRDGWPRAGARWLHSDAKNVAYAFNYMLFDDWVEGGGLE